MSIQRLRREFPSFHVSLTQGPTVSAVLWPNGWRPQPEVLPWRSSGRLSRLSQPLQIIEKRRLKKLTALPFI
jgi:hypothetical protein